MKCVIGQDDNENYETAYEKNHNERSMKRLMEKNHQIRDFRGVDILLMMQIMKQLMA